MGHNDRTKVKGIRNILKSKEILPICEPSKLNTKISISVYYKKNPSYFLQNSENIIEITVLILSTFCNYYVNLAI